MNIALIPWDDSVKQNNIFTEKYEGYKDSHILLKRSFEERGISLNTVDVYADLREVDCFLFHGLDYVWLNKVIKLGLQDRTIYCNGEPSVVKPENSKEGYQKLLNIFAIILTWNDDLVDNRRILKRNIPYYFEKNFDDTPFCNKKLLTNISGNKHSEQPYELYSERERIIDYFEENYPEHFDLYGTGWDVNRHPSYRGIAGSKAEVYHNYKFALSLENTYNVRGYITEKILDCLTAGIVPIYKGASNIADVIPDECYIHYDDFVSLDDLAGHLIGMTQEEYDSYIDAISRLLNTNIQEPFSSEKYCEYICNAISRMGFIHLDISDETKRKLKKHEMEQRFSKWAMHTRIQLKRTVAHIGHNI